MKTQTFKDIVSFYNKRFAYYKNRLIQSEPSENLKLIIVIPAFDEELETTLNSLENCTIKDPSLVEVLVVLNQSEEASEEVNQKHLHELSLHKERSLTNGIQLELTFVNDLPKKHAGVGLARKIGMDEALKRFELVNHNGLIVCLDADCEVSTNYLDSLLEAESQGYNGLSLYYEHPLEGDAESNRAIINYEIFLRYYSIALQKTNYPYFNQTVGSSMACRATIYAQIGGMNRRKAGEDFYFLHKVFPQGKFRNWPDLTVFPSARKSNRVPFGTGKAMMAIEEGTKDYSRLYNPRVFMELESFIQSLPEYYEKDESTISLISLDYLKSEDLLSELHSLKLRSTRLEIFKKNFFSWFDGLKVLKFIHHLQESQFEDLSNLESCSKYLGTHSNKPYDLLLELRDMEKKL